MADAQLFFKDVKKHPGRFLLIHYSSQSLFDASEGSFSPRITSIVVQQLSSRQTLSFSMHLIAERLAIPSHEVEARYDQIEAELLKQFYAFARDRRERYWVHWNMRNVVFGFEHIEQRYRVLVNEEPPSIPIEVRINLSDVLKDRYGGDYAPHPMMISLMDLNGPRVQGFLSGEEEAAAFKQKDFIRMNASTMAKVGFFAHVISLAGNGKLKTAAKGLMHQIDKVLSSRKNRVIGAISAAIGLAVTAAQLGEWVWTIVVKQIQEL